MSVFAQLSKNEIIELAKRAEKYNLVQDEIQNLSIEIKTIRDSIAIQKDSTALYKSKFYYTEHLYSEANQKATKWKLKFLALAAALVLLVGFRIAKLFSIF